MRSACATLALLAAMVLVIAQPLTALASAGWQEDSSCCCPSPAECHCPGHDGSGDQEDLRKCGNSGQVASPALPSLLLPLRGALPVRGLVTIEVCAALPVCVAQLILEPETPPF